MLGCLCVAGDRRGELEIEEDAVGMECEMWDGRSIPQASQVR